MNADDFIKIEHLKTQRKYPTIFHGRKGKWTPQPVEIQLSPNCTANLLIKKKGMRYHKMLMEEI
jgi:hypothetical protein